MIMRRTVPIVSTALLLAACGPTGGDDSSPAEVLPDAAAWNSGLTAAVDAGSHRVTMAMGMNVDMGMLGEAMSFEADLDTPLMVAESDADGDQHLVFTPTSMMDGALGAAGSAAFGDDLAMEIWQSDATMLVDLGGFADVLDQAGESASMLPGDVFSVDIARLAEAGGADIDATTVLSGQQAPDPIEIATMVRDGLDDVVEDPDDPNHFTGTISFDEFNTALGQGSDGVLGELGSPFDAADGADMVAALSEAVAEIVVEVDMRLADDGSADLVRFDVDLSPMWAALPEVMSASGDVEGASEMGDLGEMGEMFAELFANMTFEMTVLLDYDVDVAVDVELPAGEFPDATDQFLELVGQLDG